MTALVFTTAFMIPLLALTVMGGKRMGKHMYIINLAVFALSMGISYAYVQGGYSGGIFVHGATSCLMGFELYQASVNNPLMRKNKW